MVVIVSGAVIGAALGWFSFAFQKTFLAAIATLGAGYVMLFKTVVAPMMTVSRVDISPASAFAAMPMDYQTAAVVSLACAFAARIVTWVHVRFLKKPVVETPAARRARIYAEFGLRDPLS